MKNRIFIILSLGILIALGACAKVNLPQVDSQLSNDVGEISFYANANSIQRKQSSNRITKLNLSKDKNLYFSAMLKQPLLQYLHALDNKAEDAQLLANGNFQFVFYVNNNEVYQENLNIGAGLDTQKRFDTILSKPLFSTQNEDSWGRFLWMRFMHFGGEEALINGTNKLRMIIKPYLNSPDLIVGSIIAEGSLDLVVNKIVASEAQIAIQKIQPTAEWEISQTSYNTDYVRLINKKIAQRDFKDITSVVVIKDKQLLIEEYFNGANRKTLHDTRSTSKSVVGTLLGIAIDNQLISDTKQTLGHFYAIDEYQNFSESKSKVNLEDLLTMSSVFDGNDSDYQSIGNEENMYPTDNWVKFVLDLPVTNNRKNRWQYFTGGTVVLGDILNKTTPNGLEAFANKHLFEPLKISEFKWQYTPQGVANTAGGLALRSLDLAKFGQLYQNGGQWNNTSIVSNTWVASSLSPRISRTVPESTQAYGYLFWHDTFKVGNTRHNVVYATGNGGNKIYIFKDLPLVVVITATAYNRPYAHKQSREILLKYILPAVLE